MTGGLTVNLLGPMEVLVGGQLVGSVGGQQRRLLAVLALRPGEVVSQGQLARILWGEDAEGSSDHHALHALVGRARDALRRDGADLALVTHPSGYLLDLPPGAVDVDRFWRLLDRAQVGQATRDPAERRTLLLRALALWRGDPLEEIDLGSFGDDEVARLVNAYQRSIEELAAVEIEVQEGEPEDRLLLLLREDPLRERARELLMLAMYRGGRQADALAVFNEGQRMLADELGVDPSPPLQEMHRRILTQDPTLGTDRHSSEPDEDVNRQLLEDVVTYNKAVLYIQESDPDDPSISRTTYVAPGNVDLVGYDLRDVKRDPLLWRELVHPDDRARVFDLDAASNREDVSSISLEYRMIHSDGHVVWVQDEARAVRSKGRVTWHGVLLDITERKRY